jgi:hypothetical protein
MQALDSAERGGAELTQNTAAAGELHSSSNKSQQRRSSERVSWDVRICI